MNIALTTGDPAGIGPDITLALAQHTFPTSITVLGDAELLEQRAAQLGLQVTIDQYNANNPPTKSGNGHLSVQHIATTAPVSAGLADKRHAKYILEQIDTAVAGCLDGQFSAMTTAPVSKAVINQSGIPFSGHTEYLAQANGGTPIMMLAMNTGFRVALVTTHIPLRDVADTITREKLDLTFTVVNRDLKKFCAIEQPRIGVCGLNPHAGEQGLLGVEDETIIRPAIQDALKQGLNLIGPLPADTIFNIEQLAKLDVVIAMFHDQGLPVIKHTGFGAVANVTLGLPFLRTSVDHGTAFALAGSGKACADSLITAINWAVQAIQHARH